MTRNHAECAAYVIDSVRSLGLTPHSQSRLMRMYNAMCNPDGTPRPFIAVTDPNFQSALEAVRDMQLLEFVFEQLEDEPNQAAIRPLVSAALKDSVLPQADMRRSRGRDTQFELFVGALCRRARMYPVAHSEPDITCVHNGTAYGIAAKRVKSMSNLEKLVRKAGDQVLNSGLCGIVALDLSLALDRDNVRIDAPMSPTTFRDLYSADVDQFVQKYQPRMQEWVRGKGVRGVECHDHKVRHVQGGQWALESFTFAICTARDNQRRRREFHLFNSSYQGALPNVRRSIRPLWSP